MEMEGEQAEPPRRRRLSERQAKFLREVGSVVLGVLIALGLGAIATEIGWRVEVAQARQALGEEMGEIVGQGLARGRAHRCAEAKLDAIAAILDEAERTGRLPPAGTIGDPLYRTWSTDVWQSAISADIASHMDRHDLDNLSGAYQFVRLIDTAAQAELQAWTDLYAIVGPGRAASPEEIVRLRSALSRARLNHRQIAISGMLLARYVDRFDLPAEPETIAEYRDESIAEFCAPIPPWRGERYGMAPFARTEALTREAEPDFND